MPSIGGPKNMRVKRTGKEGASGRGMVAGDGGKREGKENEFTSCPMSHLICLQISLKNE